MVFEKTHRLSRFWKNGGDKDFTNDIFTFESGGSDFLWHLKKCIDFLDFKKMQPTRFWK